MTTRPLVDFRLVGATSVAGDRPMISLPLLGIVSWSVNPPQPGALFGTPMDGLAMTVTPGAYAFGAPDSYSRQLQASDDGLTGWTNAGLAFAGARFTLQGVTAKHIRIAETARKGLRSVTTYTPARGPVATHLPLPALPLAAGAKIGFLGDSYVQRGAFSQMSGSLMQGGAIFGRGLWSMIGSMDARFRIDVFYLDNKAYPVGAGEKMDGAIHGVGGDRIDGIGADSRPGFLGRLPDCIARGPAVIVIETPGGNNVADLEAPDLTIRKLDELLSRIRSAGIHAVVVTMPHFTAVNGDGTPRYPPASITAINDWLLAQELDGRDGLTVIDTRALEGEGVIAQDNSWLTDGAHRGTYACWRVAADCGLPKLQAMVSAGSRFDLDPLADNVFLQKGLPGTTGTKTVQSAAQGSVATITGTVAAGMNINRSAGTSAIACAKEVVSAGVEKQVVTISPINDGTLIHSLSLRDNTNGDIALASMGVDTVNDWGLEILWPVELDDWDGWDIRQVNGGPAGWGFVCYDSVSLQRTGNSASYRNGLYLMPAILQFLPGRTPTNLRIGRFTANVWGLSWRSDVSGTGVAKMHSPVIRRLATSPMAAWNL